MNWISIPEFLKIPGITLYIPEKAFFLSFLYVFIFYLLGFTKFRFNMYQNNFLKSQIFFFGTNTSM